MAPSFKATWCVMLINMLVVCTPCVEANAFLSREQEQNVGLRGASLLEELAKRLGSDQGAAVESRVQRVEESLRATFAAMPKNQYGGLGYDAVRYMVHRYFVDQHGWLVRGLETAGDAWNSSSPTAIFKEAGDEQVQVIFEKILSSGKGFNLNQVAVLAAVVESIVQSENLERLHAAYYLSGLSKKGNTRAEGVSQEEVGAVMETYMMLFVLGVDHSNATIGEMATHRSEVAELYPNWVETQKRVQQVRAEVLGENGDTSFDATVRVLEEVGDRYGRWQNSECLELKDSLMKLAVPGTGRVLLDAFYKSALEGNWQFSESVAYLRQLGALDESGTQGASLIIANYVNSPSNCVAASKYYDVCCIDECEGLLSHLELAVSAPEATPARIIELVSALPSATVQTPRVLSTTLRQRLEDIAAHHGGTVPFHGRLFAQWMHHAYPLECQYPHLSRTTNPITPEEWLELTGEESVASEEAMRWHVEEVVKKRSRTQTFTFRPGKLGIDVWETAGRIVEVYEGQANDAGVKADWHIVTVDGLAYSRELLDEKVRGSTHYEVTFSKDQYDQSRTPAGFQDELPWTAEEELFVSKSSLPQASTGDEWMVLRVFASVIALIALELKLMHALAPEGFSAVGKNVKQTHFI